MGRTVEKPSLLPVHVQVWGRAGTQRTTRAGGRSGGVDTEDQASLFGTWRRVRTCLPSAGALVLGSRSPSRGRVRGWNGCRGLRPCCSFLSPPSALCCQGLVGGGKGRQGRSRKHGEGKQGVVPAPCGYWWPEMCCFCFCRATQPVQLWQEQRLGPRLFAPLGEEEDPGHEGCLVKRRPPWPSH